MSDAYHDEIDADTVSRYQEIIEDCMATKHWGTAIDLCQVGRAKVGFKYRKYFDQFTRQIKELKEKAGE